MPKSKFLMVRVNDADREKFAATQVAGGWKSLSEMVRDLVDRAQSKQPQPQTEQPQPDHQHEKPPL